MKQKSRITYIVPIYVTTRYWNNGIRGLLDFSSFTEQELFDFLECENQERLIKVAPQQGIFIDRFIQPLLNKDGFLCKEGLFETCLCGEVVKYKVMLDPNFSLEKWRLPKFFVK